MACFRPAARQLLQEVGEPEKALAMALARVTGFSAVKVASLLSHLPCVPCYLRQKCFLKGCGAHLCTGPGQSCLYMALEALLALGPALADLHLLQKCSPQ